MHRYFILNKPAGIVSQFISSDKVPLLGTIGFDFPVGTHAIGRLDKDSEGLLLLTTNKKITRLVFSGIKPHLRTYLVMVQNEMSEATLQKLKEGVPIKIAKGEKYIAKPESVFRLINPVSLYPWAMDKRENYPHTWLLMTLTEGKFRQIRKMVLALRHRCQRLIRLSIENITIDGIKPGQVKEMDENSFFKLLKLNED
ncbi:MAG: pseudouridine synthase [Ginsengibacter sp.]